MGEPGDRRIRTVVRKFDKSLTVKAESLAGRFGAIENSAGQGAEVKFGGFQPVSCMAVETRCQPCDDHIEQSGKAGDQSCDRSDSSNGLRIKREQEKHILSFC